MPLWLAAFALDSLLLFLFVLALPLVRRDRASVHDLAAGSRVIRAGG